MYTLHLITHTHWDREWYQTFQQFRLRLVHMVDGLLDLLEKDNQYQHFMLDGQTIVLEDYLEMRPEREGDLRRYIQSGRVLVGPWYLLPDEFLVSPEATIRNLLEGDRVARRFGPKMMVGYIPDPFGHIGQMPQILRGFGIENASLWRGVDDQPNEFWWQSPDGSRVLMGYERQGYGNASGILNGGDEGFVATARGLRDTLAPHTQSENLLLMFGSDHQEVNPQTSEAVAFAAGKLDGDQMVHSTLPQYFTSVRSTQDLEKLPVVSGELRSSRFAPMLVGVLSTRMWIKQRNQACETLLEKWAEPFSAWAQAYGDPNVEGYLKNPQAILRQAWRQLMQCHPHDSICGCSIDQVHDEMRPRFDQAEQIGEEITRRSLDALAGAIHTLPGPSITGPATPVVVFNPSDIQRSDAVMVTGVELPAGGDQFELVDDQGKAIAFQVAGMGKAEEFGARMDRQTMRNSLSLFSGGSIMNMRIQDVQLAREGEEVSIVLLYSLIAAPDLQAWERSRQELETYLNDPQITQFSVALRAVPSSTLLFNAAEVPGLGYRTFWVRGIAGGPKDSAGVSAPSSNPPYRIENAFFVVEAQPDGTLDITDRRTGMLHRGQNRFVDGGDRGDEYNFSAPETDSLATAHLKSVQVERGDVQQILTLSLEIAAPEALAEDRKSRSEKTVSLPLTSRVTLTAGVPRVDIHTEVDNTARDHRLRVHFKAPFSVTAADYDGHCEVIRRPVGVAAYDETWSEQPRPEVPQRAFTSITAGQAGLLVANRGLPESQVLPVEGGSEIALTLLRSVGWLSRDDLPERREGHAGPGMATPGAQLLGKWAYDYAVALFSAGQKSAAYHQAYAFQAPLRGVVASAHPGELPSQGAFLAVEPQEFIISAIKTCEDGRGWVARGYNITDKPLKVCLQTLRPFTTAERVNLAEAPAGLVEATGPQSVTVEAGAHEIVTVAFRA